MNEHSAEATPQVAIVGPTASGKSALGVQLAEKLCGEVVVWDSTQLYRRFDFGTAKLTPAEQRGIPHHLVGLLEPEQIDLTNSQAVSLSISDGALSYTRNASVRNANGQGVVAFVPLEANGNVAHSLWVSYYRTNETDIADVYPYGATVQVRIQAIDVTVFPGACLFQLQD